MRRFARWHIWLGWLVGLPIVMWTVSGLVMIIQPIESVRGSDRRLELPPVAADGLVLPQLTGPVRSVTLQNFVDGAGWIVVEDDGGRYRYSASDGSLYNPVGETAAREIAQATFTGDAALEGMTYFPADEVPRDFRNPVNVWQARFADDTNLYINAQTGEVQAVRTGWWRIYDFFWGLHIMDLETRDLEGQAPFNHWVLVVFAALSVAGSLIGCTLMFRRRKAKLAVTGP
ncbi:hypothetical protein GRI62_03895 [Erythrobacter arachoides]|uniref:PepSY domain-containing protein n=2 Tax=Aurantiacibacter arachoides TaxID=1850444 RepID=A0A844ZZS5_9SPHN|nr:PepSY domain-containing protein [Aurantiacibacter arachoides]MXO92750.1 hypothetical protein [Aurantiacibacter arachoides]GGD54781.1 hypothetical protein GCM10011411_13400 [Aurantiacibacter arachoides]